MMLLHKILQQRKVQRCFNLCSYLMVAMFALQSVFAAASGCAYDTDIKFSAATVLQLSAVEPEITEVFDLVTGRDAVLTSESSQDECADHNSNCCACCASSMLTALPEAVKIKASMFLFKALKSTPIDSHFYALLRPPKPAIT